MFDEDLGMQIEELRLRIEQLEAESSSSQSTEAEPCDCDQRSSQGATAQPVIARMKLAQSGETLFPGLEAAGERAAGGILRIRDTIDSTRTDNGFLGCVYARYKACSNTTVLSHSSTQGAGNNIRTGREGWSVLVGHGAPGLIITGTGQIMDGKQKYISASNMTSWKPILSKGVVGGGLTLFGCEVAAGTAGDKLLTLVANTIRKPVGAWTGNVWCSSTSVYGTGTFITKNPGAKAIEYILEDAPKMYSDEAEPLQVMRLASHGEEFEDVKPDHIISVHFSPVGSFAGVSDIRTMRAERADALSVLQRIDLENPFVTEDKPGAIHVGMLNVSYGVSGSHDEHIRTFKVLGSSLLQDATYPNTYYYASQELQQLLR
jgi:hypothetical protein